MSKDKELQELNNIKYKSMILTNNSRNNLSPIETNDTSNINDFLDKRMQNKKYNVINDLHQNTKEN